MGAFSKEDEIAGVGHYALDLWVFGSGVAR